MVTRSLVGFAYIISGLFSPSISAPKQPTKMKAIQTEIKQSSESCGERVQLGSSPHPGVDTWSFKCFHSKDTHNTQSGFETAILGPGVRCPDDITLMSF